MENKDKIYWTTKNGTKINVDEMSIGHLRNTLKMIIKSKSVHTFTRSKDSFLNKERSVGKWLVNIENRGEDTAPLVIIDNIKKDRFDVSHTKSRLKVINDVLKII